MNNQLNISALASVDIQKMNKDELVDVSGLALDPGVPQELRAGYILKATGNPYCFRVGDLGVSWSFWTAPRPYRMPFPTSFSGKRAGFNLFPNFWTLCPEVEASLLCPWSRGII